MWSVQEINLSSVTDGGAPQFGGKLKFHAPVISCGAGRSAASARKIFPLAVRNSMLAIAPGLHDRRTARGNAGFPLRRLADGVMLPAA